MFIPDAELDEFWASLQPASIDFMIGEWIDDDAAMGIMNGKNALDDGRHAYFYLERI